MIAGTIRNAVKMAALDGEWQRKKSSGGLRENKKKELTAAERELARLREQAEDIRRSREYADIDAKLKAGQKLTSEEIAYLKKNNPQALKEYEEIQEQRKAYKEALKNCRSKEEVERLKVTKMGQFMAQAKEISNNPNIPEGQKKAMLDKLLKLLSGVQQEHLDFEKSLQYQMLPEEDEDRDEGRRGGAENVEEDGGGEPEVPDAQPWEEAGTAQEPFPKALGSERDEEVVSQRIAAGSTAGTKANDAGMLVDIRL